MDRERFAEGLLALGLPNDDALLDDFVNFERDIYLANETMNVTRVTPDECWLRHFLDSLLFHDLMPAGSIVLDIGTGPGFPAWPLARARPDLEVTAMDSNGKMLAFLGAHQLPNMKILQARAEDKPFAGAFHIVTGRALAPLPIQLELSVRPAKVGGAVLPMRSARDGDTIRSLDVTVLGLQLETVVERELGDAVRLMPVYRKTRVTPSGYPRRWAEIKARPLGS